MKNIIFTAMDVGEVSHINAMVASEMHSFSSNMFKDGPEKGAVFAPIHSTCDITGERLCIGMIASAPTFDNLKLPLKLMTVCNIQEISDVGTSNPIRVSRVRVPGQSQQRRWMKHFVGKGAEPDAAKKRVRELTQKKLAKTEQAPFYWYKQQGGRNIPVLSAATPVEGTANHRATNTLGAGETVFASKVTVKKGFLFLDQ